MSVDQSEMPAPMTSRVARATSSNGNCAADHTDSSETDQCSLLQHEERPPHESPYESPASDMSHADSVQARVVYYVFCLLGMSTLLPWNFFITADAYWNYKFRNVNESTGANSSANSSSHSADTELQRNFYGYLSVASMVPNTLLLIVMALLSQRVRLHLSLQVSLSLVIVLFILTTFLVPISCDTWQHGFLAVTLVSVAAMNACSAVFQSGLFVLAARLPGNIVAALMSGQALGAVFACVVRLVSVASATASQASGPDPDQAGSVDDHGALLSALVYFILADVTLILSMIAYMYVRSLDFYRRHTSNKLVTPTDQEEDAAEEEQEEEQQQQQESLPHQDSSTDVSGAGQTPAAGVTRSQVKKRHRPGQNGTSSGGGSPLVNGASSPANRGRKVSQTASLWTVLKKIRLYAVSVWLVFVVTLSVFPAIANKVIPVSAVDSIWARDYFVPVCCFLLYNLGDLAGRLSAGHRIWPGERGGPWLLVLSVARAALVPLLMVCNLHHHHLPTVFPSDIQYVLTISIIGLSNGYLANLCMIYAPRVVEAHERNMASTLMVAFLGIGLCCGALLSNLLIQLL